ncbi:MAG: acetolactate decarboxylase [Candidatus Theseobacter exili]|nr:acetolactate decarboxylase [Candidatus Theseobacter exili]
MTMNLNESMDLNTNRIYLCAPVIALVEGIYEEKIPLSQIKMHGDFGLGTFDDLDGEMVMLDGEIYQIAGTGQVHRVTEQALTPFACVTFYRSLCQDRLEVDLPYADFKAWIERLLPSPNIFYALRIEGLFSYIKVRSVPKQENYRPLVEAAQEQQVFTFTDIEGTLLGFFTPGFMGFVNVPGLHLHFLSADRRRGGHLLECRPSKVEVGVQMLPSLELSLPMSLDYLTWDFSRDPKADLNKAEQ